MQNNKKGNLGDIGTALGIILGLVITLFLCWIVFEGFKTNMSTNPAFDNSTKESYQKYETNYLRGWDLGFLLLILLLPVVSYMWAKNLPSEPIYMVFFFVIHVIILVLAMVVSNIYGAFMDNALFTQFATNLKIIPFIMPKLVYWVMIYISVIVIGLYSKDSSG
jgi:hypothetical protein